MVVTDVCTLNDTGVNSREERLGCGGSRGIGSGSRHHPAGGSRHWLLQVLRMWTQSQRVCIVTARVDAGMCTVPVPLDNLPNRVLVQLASVCISRVCGASSSHSTSGERTRHGQIIIVNAHATTPICRSITCHVPSITCGVHSITASHLPGLTEVTLISKSGDVVGVRLKWLRCGFSVGHIERRTDNRVSLCSERSLSGRASSLENICDRYISSWSTRRNIATDACHNITATTITTSTAVATTGAHASAWR